jgi:hypothetical protein
MASINNNKYGYFFYFIFRRSNSVRCDAIVMGEFSMDLMEELTDGIAGSDLATQQREQHTHTHAHNDCLRWLQVSGGGAALVAAVSLTASCSSPTATPTPVSFVLLKPDISKLAPDRHIAPPALILLRPDCQARR